MEFGDHLRSRQLKRACSTHSSTLESSVPVLAPLFPLSLLAHFHRGKWVPKGSPEDWEAQNQKVTPDKVLMFHHNMATVTGQGGAQGRVWGGKRGDLESRKWPILLRNSQVSSGRHEFLLKTLPFTTATTETKSQCEFEPPALMWKPAWWHASVGPVLCGCGQEDNWGLLIASWALGTVRDPVSWGRRWRVVAKVEKGHLMSSRFSRVHMKFSWLLSAPCDSTRAPLPDKFLFSSKWISIHLTLHWCSLLVTMSTIYLFVLVRVTQARTA